MSQTILEMAKDLVLAQLQVKALAPDDMHHTLQQTHTTLMTLKAQEDAGGSTPGAIPETSETLQGLVNWRKSITKHTVTCLSCGAKFKHLSGRHLKEHGLDRKTYRIKYGIPRAQALAAKESTSRRKAMVQKWKPWEKAPTYLKAQEKAQKTVAQRKGTARAKA
jgi:predicted transcriptional regulator